MCACMYVCLSACLPACLCLSVCLICIYVFMCNDPEAMLDVHKEHRCCSMQPQGCVHFFQCSQRPQVLIPRNDVHMRMENLRATSMTTRAMHCMAIWALLPYSPSSNTDVCLCVCVCVHAYKPLCIYIYIHMYIHTHRHTHTHTHMYMYSHL